MGSPAVFFLGGDYNCSLSCDTFLITWLRLLSLSSAQISAWIWESGPGLIKSVITLFFGNTAAGLRLVSGLTGSLNEGQRTVI